MIRSWLERNGWTWVRGDDDDDLYVKGNPVCMNTAAALFSELTDREANHESRRLLLIGSNEMVEHLREENHLLLHENRHLRLRNDRLLASVEARQEAMAMEEERG